MICSYHQNGRDALRIIINQYQGLTIV
jgi:hypothetical protein